MENNKREFLEKVSNLYLIAMLVVLPLYMEESYWRLGDAKYLLFRNVTIISLLLFVLGEAFWGLYRIFSEKKIRIQVSLSAVDMAMLFYGGGILLSFLCSAYRETAWNGYRDWYMGTFTQLLFIGGYFFVSRCYTGSPFPVYAGEAALLAVSITGILQRLGIDPLRLLAGYGPGDWEYSHMLSTVGNINWLCGYCSVALAFPVVGFLYGKRKGKMLLLYGISVLTLLLLCIQGSAGGILLVFVCLGSCMLFGLKKPDFFRRGMLLGAGTTFLISVMSVLLIWRGAKATIPGDGHIYEIIAWKGWFPISALLFVICVMLYKIPPKACILVGKILFVLTFIACIFVFCFFVTRTNWQEGWGSGRGELWSLSLEGFRKAGWLQKLTGAGPDCFAQYIYKVLPARQMIHQSGHWANAVFANAHNEWLNHLVNIGLLGTAGYFSIFAAGFVRYRKMLLGIFVLTQYLFLSVFSFQQVLSTPLFFLVLGICESRLRSVAASERNCNV